MCTSNLYRVVDLDKVDKHTGKLKSYIVSGKTYDVEEYRKHPFKWFVQPIPCGNCLECKLRKSQEWSFRCMKEASKYENNIMLTLTYDDEHLPKSKYVNLETGELFESLTLKKDDVQKFMKRLRKKFGEGIRFFMCGEYGSDSEYKDWKGQVRKGTERPHYHIILFNIKVEDLRFYKWSFCDWSKDKYPLFKSKTMEKLWPFGFVDLNEVTKETCDYVARYTTKKLKGDYAKKEYEEKGRIPPYLNMSRNPGIGYDFFEENKEKFLNDSQSMYLKTKKGLVDIGTVRYYDKQIEKVAPETLKEIKNKRIDSSRSTWDDKLSKTNLKKYEYINNQDIRNELKRIKLQRGLV